MEKEMSYGYYPNSNSNNNNNSSPTDSALRNAEQRLNAQTGERDSYDRWYEEPYEGKDRLIALGIAVASAIVLWIVPLAGPIALTAVIVGGLAVGFGYDFEQLHEIKKAIKSSEKTIDELTLKQRHEQTIDAIKSSGGMTKTEFLSLK
jgi:hypothetical protein